MGCDGCWCWYFVEQPGSPQEAEEAENWMARMMAGPPTGESKTDARPGESKTDDVAGGGTGVSSGLHFDRGARMFSMVGPGLSLPPASEVATTGNDEGKDNHGQNRRDPGRNTGPVEVNKLSLIHI